MRKERRERKEKKAKPRKEHPGVLVDILGLLTLQKAESEDVGENLPLTDTRNVADRLQNAVSVDGGCPIVVGRLQLLADLEQGV